MTMSRQWLAMYVAALSAMFIAPLTALPICVPRNPANSLAFSLAFEPRPSTPWPLFIAFRPDLRLSNGALANSMRIAFRVLLACEVMPS